MRLISSRDDVLLRLRNAGRSGIPILCPNAETPDEMEGIMLAAQRCAVAADKLACIVGIGFTAGYPDHSQLGGIAFPCGDATARIKAAAETWLNWLGSYADRPGLLDEVEVIPFLDHGWAPHEADLNLMKETWFQMAVGIILFDASAYDTEENIRLTAEFVRGAGRRVVIEACPDKVYERREVLARGLREADLLSRPEAVERFVARTGADLIVPNLGTEHRSAGDEPLQYRRDLAQEILRRVGPVQALHGSSSLGGRLGTVGHDGICKINYYTAMAGAATGALRLAWDGVAGSAPLALARSCGSFVHRTRREAVAENIFGLLNLLGCP